MRLDISILVAAAAVGAQAKAFHLKYPGPLVRTKRPEKPAPKAPEVTALQLDSEAEDHGKQWVEVVTEINANTIKARDDGGLLEGCHGKECGKRFYVDEPKKEEHYADEGFEEKYWVEQITSHKEDSHRHKSEVDHHDYYHRYNDTDDHYHHHHHHHKDPKKGKKAKLEAREADLSEGEGEVPEGGDNDKLWTGPVVKATPDMRKEAKERINAIKRYQKRADIVCSEERPKQLYTKGQEDLERKAAKAFLTFCKTVDAVKKLIGEIAENRAILHQKVKLCLDKKISEKHEAPAPHNEWDTRSVEQRLEALCWKELYQADKVPKIQPKIAAREANPLSAEAAADGEEYIRKRIHELKEKKKEEEEKEKKHDHKDDIEYYREEIHHEIDESHNAEHHHDSFYNVHHKPIHHHHHHDKKKGEEAKGRNAKKVETRDVDVEGDYHEGLASENVCTYFRGIAYKAKSLHRPVEQFQYENVPWLVHARGPWHHVLEGLRQIEWVLAKVARGLHETSGFTAKEERELVGCYYAFAGINSPNGDNGQPFKKLLHLLAERSKMAKYEPYAQKRVHDVVRNLEMAYLTANDQLFRVMRQDKYRANILWDVEDKDGALKYFAEVLRVYDVEKDKIKV